MVIEILQAGTGDSIWVSHNKKNIVIVTGFQGINRYDDMTTLGRGGSDTSAVAIAAVMNADLCQIYTDVEGVFTADPRKVKNARKLQNAADLVVDRASLDDILLFTVKKDRKERGERG